MNIFNSLGSNYNLDYLRNGFLSLFKGDNENELKEMLQGIYGGEAVLFYKGREAIEASLKIANISPGNYVAINGFTCYVVEKAVKNAGLKCEYLDIGDDYNFSAQSLESAIKRNDKIKAVIIQNTLGNISDYQSIKNICVKNNLVLIEDLAHTTASNNTDFTALSFSQDKAIDSVSGGALIVRNAIYEKNIYKIKQKNVSSKTILKDFLYPYLTFIIRYLYPVGIGKVLHYVFKKLNVLSTPMGDQDNNLHFLPKWHANMVINYLKNIENINKHRKSISKIYGGTNTNIRYPILVKNRSKFIKIMKNEGVYISDIWYESTIAPKKYMISSDYKIGMCPKADNASNNIVNLPTHINVSEKDALKIMELIKKWNTIQ